MQRKLNGDQINMDAAKAIFTKVQRLLTQQRTDKNKVYSLHAPELECIVKGKVRQAYEFGVKVSIATTHREGLVVDINSMPGNPYDGHTLPQRLYRFMRSRIAHPKRCLWIEATVVLKFLV